MGGFSKRGYPRVPKGYIGIMRALIRVCIGIILTNTHVLVVLDSNELFKRYHIGGSTYWFGQGDPWGLATESL